LLPTGESSMTGGIAPFSSSQRSTQERLLAGSTSNGSSTLGGAVAT
jgi:hypothetical protein